MLLDTRRPVNPLIGLGQRGTIIDDMTEIQAASQRRSSRVFTRLSVRVKGNDNLGRKFRETCQTIVINAHGGLLYMQQALQVGADLVLNNPVTDEEQLSRVVYIGDTSDKGTRVGVEFLVPSPQFWGVEFAAADWSTSKTESPQN
jgi:hypothetical protein